MKATPWPSSKDQPMMRMKILVVEDDFLLGKSLRTGLTQAGHNCLWVKGGKKGLEHGLSQLFDAIVLDLLLPDVPGMDVLRQIRGAGVRTPILLLTGLDSVEDRVRGLQAGADAYLVKPFSFVELMARLERLCCRSVDRPPFIMTNGDLRLDLTTRRVHQGDTEINLTATEVKILELLMRHAGQFVTRKMLSEYLWDTDWDGTKNFLEIHISRIRKKLDHKGPTSIIQTKRGIGYALRMP